MKSLNKAANNDTHRPPILPGNPPSESSERSSSTAQPKLPLSACHQPPGVLSVQGEEEDEDDEDDEDGAGGDESVLGSVREWQQHRITLSLCFLGEREKLKKKRKKKHNRLRCAANQGVGQAFLANQERALPGGAANGSAVMEMSHEEETSAKCMKFVRHHSWRQTRPRCAWCRPQNTRARMVWRREKLSAESNLLPSDEI